MRIVIIILPLSQKVIKSFTFSFRFWNPIKFWIALTIVNWIQNYTKLG